MSRIEEAIKKLRYCLEMARPARERDTYPVHIGFEQMEEIISILESEPEPTEFTKQLTAKMVETLNEQKQEIERLTEGNKNILSGHFCPNPQLSEFASTCDCVHSDRHRKQDWETIDRLTAELKAKEEQIKYLSEILHFGNQDRTMISMIGKAEENKEQALRRITSDPAIT